jgi:hypothetical protein
VLFDVGLIVTLLVRISFGVFVLRSSYQMKISLFRSTGSAFISSSLLAFFLVGCGSSEVQDTPSESASSETIGGPAGEIVNGLPQSASIPAIGEAAPPADMNAIIQQGQAMQVEMQGLMEQLREIQSKAFEHEDVIAMRKALEDAATDAMLKESPDSRETLDRLPELVAELEANQEIIAGDPSKFSEATQKLFEEFQTLTASIEPLQQKVSVLPEIEEARAALVARVQAECLKIDPEFSALEEKQQDLGTKLQQLQQAYMSAQGVPAGGAPPYAP